MDPLWNTQPVKADERIVFHQSANRVVLLLQRLCWRDRKCVVYNWLLSAVLLSLAVLHFCFKLL